MASGLLELLEKLVKERGTGIMSGGKDTGSKGYQSFIDKNKFTASDNYNPTTPQMLDPLANTTQYNNATTNALDTMRGLQQGGKYGGNYYAGTGGQDLLFRNPDPFNPNPKPFINPPPEKFWNDGTTSNDPNMLQPLGAVSNVDRMFAQALNALPPREQAEIVQTTRGYTDEQVENFKIKYLQGRVSSYELERPYLQSNLGFQ